MGQSTTAIEVLRVVSLSVATCDYVQNHHLVITTPGLLKLFQLQPQHMMGGASWQVLQQSLIGKLHMIEFMFDYLDPMKE